MKKPASPNTDEGLDAGGNLLDEMTDTVDEFNATVNEKTQVMIDNVTKVKPLVDGVFGYYSPAYYAFVSLAWSCSLLSARWWGASGWYLQGYR